MSETKINVALIGCGMRATAYFRNIPEELKGSVRLSAVADPSQENRQFFIERFGDEGTVHYDDALELIARERADALIIASPNHCHADQLTAALSWNVPVLMEKPICIRLDDCRKVWQAWSESERPLVSVGFVLRYTPFYRKVLEIVRSGVLGQILQIDGDEIIGTALTSVFFRAGWRLCDEISGGLLLEKCSHDLDVLSLLADAPVKRVCSFAQRTHFVPRPRSEQHPRFDPEVTRRLALDYGDLHIKRHFESVSDESVYNDRSDVPDHQSVMIEHENGVLSNLTVTFGQPRQTRLIRIMGSNGMLTGDIQASVIDYEVGNGSADGWESFRVEIEHDASGHNGGDSVINASFWDAVAGKPSETRAGLREGLEAVVTAVCAEQSKESGLPVDVAAARAIVFGSPVPEMASLNHG